MKHDALSRRLRALEPSTDEHMTKFSFQWFNGDGSPKGKKIERLIPQSRCQRLSELLHEHAQS